MYLLHSGSSSCHEISVSVESESCHIQSTVLSLVPGAVQMSDFLQKTKQNKTTVQRVGHRGDDSFQFVYLP